MIIIISLFARGHSLPDARHDVQELIHASRQVPKSVLQIEIGIDAEELVDRCCRRLPHVHRDAHHVDLPVGCHQRRTKHVLRLCHWDGSGTAVAPAALTDGRAVQYWKRLRRAAWRNRFGLLPRCWGNRCRTVRIPTHDIPEHVRDMTRGGRVRLEKGWVVAVHVPRESLPDLGSSARAELASRKDKRVPVHPLDRAPEVGQRFSLELNQGIHEAGARDSVLEAHAHEVHVVLLREEELLHLVGSQDQIEIDSREVGSHFALECKNGGSRLVGSGIARHKKFLLLWCSDLSGVFYTRYF